MVEILISVAAKVAEYLLEPITLQLSYPFTYHRHVQDLIPKIHSMYRARRRVEELVEDANRQGDEIFPHVLKWLEATQGILRTAENLVQGEERVSQQGCFHLKSRYNLGRRAKRQREDIDAKLEQARGFDETVSRRPPPAPLIRSASSINDGAFPSRESIFNQIMEALRNEQTSIVGLSGMGGVGKTTLALKVAKRAEEEKLFDKVVMASSISQIRNIPDIQTELARTLGLRFGEGEDRSVALLNSLKNRKKILVILDDVWDKLDLREIGIPYGDDHRGCKLLLTSRDRRVLDMDMEAQRMFHLPQLAAEEAWSLFRRTAGDSVEEWPELKAIADDILRKCEGVPIAITTIAKVLKNKSVAEWKYALKELKMAEPTNVRGVSKNVYSCLESSYNHLEGDEVKSLFLLCGLLGGCRISKDHLLLYAMGLNMFGFPSVEDATNKLITLVAKLMASGLLLDAEEGDNDARYKSLFFDDPFVKMHDVVRDVARSIASKDLRYHVVREAVELREWERRGESRNYHGISLECEDIDELPPKLVCAQLELFLLMNSSLNRLRIPDAFFRSVTKLEVLHLCGVSLRPSSLRFLLNLRTLCLIGCQIGDMTIMGEMKRLQALSLAKSTIEELPKEIGQLRDMRVLDLQDCTELRIIPRNVISSLSGLECLNLRGCNGIEWGRDRESNNNNNKTCLSEIKDLPQLRMLEVQVSDPYLIPEDIRLDFINLTRYSIRIKDKGLTIEDCSTIRHIFYSFVWPPSPRNKFCWLDRLDLFQLPDLESVFNFNESAPILVESFGKLRFLRLRNCEKLRCVMSLPIQYGRELTFFPRLQKLVLGDLPHLISFCSTTIPEHSQVPMSIFNQEEAFPDLETLEISTLKGAVEIWRGQFSEVSFSNLRVLSVTNCYGVSVVISSNMVHKLHNLEELKVRECGLMKEVVQLIDDELTIEINFIKLKSLELDILPNLKGFCLATCTFGFPSLERLLLSGCPKMELFCKGVRSSNEAAFLELGNVSKFSEMSFSNLRVLSITDYHSIRVVISRNMVHKLHNLEELKVMKCDSVNEVVQLLDEPTIEIEFSRLKSLVLDSLPNLKSFCSSATSHTFRFPSLEKLTMKHCPKMEFFCKGIVLHTLSLKFEGINMTL